MSLDDLEAQAAKARADLAKSLDEMSTSFSKKSIKDSAAGTFRGFFFDQDGNLEIQRVIGSAATLLFSIFVLFGRDKKK
jgi:hypothetical protein